MVEYRMGTVADTEAIAEHMLAASGGVFDYLLEGLLPGAEVSDILAISIASPESTFYYENCIVADLDGRCVGVLNAYSSDRFGLQGEIRNFIPDDRAQHLENLMNSKIEDSYYINTLSVDVEAHRQGIGRELMELAVRQAREQGVGKVSLHVWSDNENALRFYRNFGFETYEAVKIPQTKNLQHEGYMLLMWKMV